MPAAQSRPSPRSEARLRVVNEEGDIYAARTTDGLWIKIGFSLQVNDRIRALNWEYRSRVVFELVATTRSTFRDEQKLHRAMRPLHQVHIGAGKEFYPTMPAVLTIVEELIERLPRLYFDLDATLALNRACREAAKEDQNRLPALQGHCEIVERNECARAANMARTLARIRAREAGRFGT